MGFGEFFDIRPFPLDFILVTALREHWDEDFRAFVMPWGHMLPMLEDVV